MKILIFEYITGGGMADQALPSLLVGEGDMMRNAVVGDFRALPNVEVRALLDYRLSHLATDDTVLPEHGYIEKIEELSNWFDALLIIAPETDGALHSLCDRFSRRNFVLFNSSVESIGLTSDKYATYKYLQAYDIPQIPTYVQDDELQGSDYSRWVIKPVDGVGCKHLVLLPDQDGLARELEKRAGGQFIVQPFMKGIHASLSLMCRDGRCLLLSVNEQHLIERDGNLTLRQCIVNAFDGSKWRSFSENLVRALPGLQGYVGADVLITREQTLLVEVNPRLTTSYVGLRKALGINPAGLMMECFMRRRLPRLNAVRDDIATVTLRTERAA